MDRIEAMRLFVSVAETGGFTAAGRRAGVTPAQVSKKIAALEDHLAARLFERTTRSVSLTPAGAAYLERVRSLLGELDALEDGVRSHQSVAAGVLRVTAPVHFGAHRLTPAILSFLDAYPRVDVRLVLADRMVDLVDEGFDVAVRIGRMDDSSLIARRLAPVRLVLAARPDHPAVASVRRPADLADQVCVIDTNYPTPRRWGFRRADAHEEVSVGGRLEVNSADAARQAALAGSGVVLSPAFVIEADLAAGRLAQVLPDWDAEPRDAWAVFPQNRYLAQRVRVFVDHLVEAFAGQ